MKKIVSHYGKWILLSAGVGVGCGLASGVFLLALEFVTHFRDANSWLLWLLPIGGLMVGGVYHAFGKSVDRGNNLIIDEFHDPKTVIPFRMAPLVLIGTLLTHLFGGSAGREGTAVQMGASISDQFTRWIKTTNAERRILLMAGMSGGFGSVFGVPLAGTIFGLEVLVVGKLQIRAIIECAVAAFVAHFVTIGLGVHHTPYPHLFMEFSWLNLVMTLPAGIVFGLSARLFVLLSDGVSRSSRRLIPYLPLRACIGGFVVASMYLLAPVLQRYVGLGVPLLVESMHTPLPLYDWLGKTVMTALTLGTGFKGGEVTPLLFIGATLGNAFSQFLPISLPLFACLGFVSVFAGAANTPLACALMAAELFGYDIFIYAILTCFISFLISSRRGIYHAQRVQTSKVNYATGWRSNRKGGTYADDHPNTFRN